MKITKGFPAIFFWRQQDPEVPLSPSKSSCSKHVVICWAGNTKKSIWKEMRIGSEKETQRACWKNCYLGYKAPKAKWRPAPRKARFLCDKDVKLAATEKVSLWSQMGLWRRDGWGLPEKGWDHTCLRSQSERLLLQLCSETATSQLLLPAD